MKTDPMHHKCFGFGSLGGSLDSGSLNRLLIAKGLRAFGDGLVSLLLPLYLLELGYGPLQVGIIATATLLAAGALKIVYDLLLLLMFRKVRPPEEERVR